MRGSVSVCTEDAVLDDVTNLSEVFFDSFPPCVVGYAKLIDEDPSNPNSPYYAAFKKEHIKFYNEVTEDPDHLVKWLSR